MASILAARKRDLAKQIIAAALERLESVELRANVAEKGDQETADALEHPDYDAILARAGMVAMWISSDSSISELEQTLEQVLARAAVNRDNRRNRV